MILCDNSESQPQYLISVAIPRPLPGLFTYKVPVDLVPLIKLGGWVRVPFGRSVTHAFVVEPPRLIDDLKTEIPSFNLKCVLEVSDSDFTLPEDILALCRWAHEYYSAPLGEILNCAAPTIAASKKLKRGPRTLAKPKLAKNVFKFTLTPDQTKAIDILDQARQEGPGRVALLKGVTGSGKTEVYIELARRTLQEGKGVLILVPEIALTPQLHRRFEEGLGISVGQWHSAISQGLRRDQYAAIRSGELKIVIGARSAIFAPIQKLGLLIVDEEHDPTYKQEDRVRYHARDLAVVRTKIANAFAVLGSATPSLETLERVREGRYLSAFLNHRIASGGLPRIEMIDLKVEDRVKNIQAFIAQKTLKTIQETIDAGEQVIVYLNRRGFASFILCSDCGEVKGCAHCSISLTLHKKKSQLRCHICGHYEAIPDRCSKCQGSKLRAMGAGTESLEAELPKLITGAKILRLDRDQVTSATRLNQLLNDFRKGEANLLLGTQMLVKGHDFPRVTLVVVVLADSLFRWPDFRAPERAVQILKQVAGRAGRGEKPGKVLIQTFDVNHPVLQVIEGHVKEDDFLESERQLRQALRYPPFGRLLRLRFESSSRENAIARSTAVARLLKSELQDAPPSSEPALRAVELLGPSEAFMEKVRATYRWDLLLKARNIQSLQKAIACTQKYCAKQKWQFASDIDPYAL